MADGGTQKKGRRKVGAGDDQGQQPITSSPHPILSPDPMTPECDIQCSVAGTHLDLEALLAEAVPNRAHEVWRRGDPVPGREPARTSGVRISLLAHAHPDTAPPAIEAFLRDEQPFLAAAVRHATGDARVVLECALWVFAAAPASIALPPATLRALAGLGIAWEVTGYPCSDDDRDDDTGYDDDDNPEDLE